MHIIEVPKIVIDGGPCGGKSTALAQVVETLTERGWLVIVLHEIATEMKMAGFWFGDEMMEPEVFQRHLMSYMKMKEDTWEQMARHMRHKDPNKIVIICDRGLMCSKAYLENDSLFHEILDDIGLNEVHTRDKRYKAIIHMVTAPEEFYTLENNVARHESYADAIRRDKLIRAAWTGAPHLRVINNNGDFSKKVKQVVAEICSALGEPVPLEIERRFLIERPSDELLKELFAVELQIKQTYLFRKEEGRERVRQRGNGVYNVYTHTIKQHVETGSAREMEQIISGQTYRKFLLNTDPTRRPLEKNRSCFIDPFDHQLYYWEVDRYITPDLIIKPNQAMMELECHNLDEHVEYPPGIKVIAEVTGDDKYSNSEMALI